MYSFVSIGNVLSKPTVLKTNRLLNCKRRVSFLQCESPRSSSISNDCLYTSPFSRIIADIKSSKHHFSLNETSYARIGCKTPLMIAALEGDLDACSLLIENCSNINEQDDMEYTALMYAVRDGYLSIVELLLQNGADPTITTKNGYCPMLCAANNGYDSIISILDGKVSVNVKDDEGRTPLMCSCANAHIDCIRLLLHMGADPNDNDIKGNSAISLAFDSGNISVIRVFLQNDIYIHFSIGGKSVAAIQAAASRGDEKLTRLFLLYSKYFREFMNNLLFSSNLATECFVLRQLFNMNSVLTAESRRKLRCNMTRIVCQYLRCLIDMVNGISNCQIPLSGLVEASVWIIRCIKILSDDQRIDSLEFFWSFVEEFVSLQNSILCKHVLVQHSLSDNASDSTLCSICTNENVTCSLYHDSLSECHSNSKYLKLIYSIIEIFCVGDCSYCCSISNSDGCESIIPQNRVISFMKSNELIIK